MDTTLPAVLPSVIVQLGFPDRAGPNRFQGKLPPGQEASVVTAGTLLR
jgi:hypothetical protein